MQLSPEGTNLWAHGEIILINTLMMEIYIGSSGSTTELSIKEIEP